MHAGNRYADIPDDVDVFRHLAKLYSFTHPTMHLGAPCPNDGERFPDGITSGSAWYLITGCVFSWSIDHVSSFPRLQKLCLCCLVCLLGLSVLRFAQKVVDEYQGIVGVDWEPTVGKNMKLVCSIILCASFCHDISSRMQNGSR